MRLRDVGRLWVRSPAARQLHDVDPLTGLGGPGELSHVAHSVLSKGSSYAEVALILLDIDRFQTLSEQLGEQTGDLVLLPVASLLVARSGRLDLVARMAGDRFAVLLPGCAELAAVARAEELRADVRRQPFKDELGQSLPVSISAGVSHSITRTTSVEMLLTQALQGLANAKQAGRNRVGRPAASIH